VSKHQAKPTTFAEKVSAQLQEAKSQIEAIEASAKGKLGHAEIEAINDLKTKSQEIDKKSQDLKTTGEAKAAQLKAEIETDLAKFKAAAEQLTTKPKSHSATK
jgi:hypothetical protein